MRSIIQLEKEMLDLIERTKVNKKKNYDSMLNEGLLKQMMIKSSRLDQAREICNMIERESDDPWSVRATSKDEINTVRKFKRELIKKIRGSESKKKENKR